MNFFERFYEKLESLGKYTDSKMGATFILKGGSSTLNHFQVFILRQLCTDTAQKSPGQLVKKLEVQTSLDLHFLHDQGASFLNKKKKEMAGKVYQIVFMIIDGLATICGLICFILSLTNMDAGKKIDIH